MKKNQSNLNNNSSINNSQHKNILKEISLQISDLSYEESLEELDLLLKRLQEETILLEELQQSYLKANLYLKHCQQLLSKIEQEVIQISADEL